MKLRAFVVTQDSIVTLSPAPSKRQWMEDSAERFAYRCLPLLIANQAGWFVELTEDVELLWNGRNGMDDIQVFGSDLVKSNVASHFGGGILTFKLPYLFRTEPGYNLLARGPANVYKDGVHPLEGLVEADWSTAPFTMNWKITRAQTRIRFEKGEPICMLVPMRRRELESFNPDVYALNDDPEVSKEYRLWRESRSKFISDLAAREDETVKVGWQRDYFLGRGPSTEADSGEHQTKLTLKPFVRKGE
ncbi:MAG: hypothetical protein IPK82_35425 [Polyangiaceae bacterium]|nr:hypothetical protein [Polyangiaceae bacterium]